MLKTASKGTPDRSKTDQSLDSERRNADQALAEQRSAVESDADRVVELARDNADAVLLEARTRADRKLESALPTSEVRAVIRTERQFEDRVVQRERDVADASLLKEREQNTRDLLALLPLERISTDRSLLTERVRSDKEVTQRDDFLSIVSHDLRDLLGGIVTTAATLQRSAPEGGPGNTARSAAERIQRYSARMKRLIEDLTDVASIDAGKLAVTAIPGDLAPVIAEAVVSMRGAAAMKDISIELSDESAPLPVVFDGDRALQVLTNLISNAIKFTPTGGTIRVGSERLDHAVRVWVTDTGPGIPAEFIDSVFERFRQLALTDRRGLGLGLYISRCLIEAQRGRIWIESEVGKGTTVSMTLPSALAA